MVLVEYKIRKTNKYLGDFDKPPTPVLFYVKVESFALNLQHFRRQLLLALLALLTYNTRTKRQFINNNFSYTVAMLHIVRLCKTADLMRTE